MEPSARRALPSRLLALCFVSLSIAAGCGHPATRDECVSIFTKSAELSLREQKVEHPEVIRSRTEQFMASDEGQELIKQCEGKRITESALRCVEKAESAEQIDSCLY